MSNIEIKVPVLGESIVEATISKWIRKKGDSVKQDELLLELETDKITLEILAPQDGVIEEILSEQGSLVKIGQTVAVLLIDQDNVNIKNDETFVQRTEEKSLEKPSQIEEKKIDIVFSTEEEGRAIIDFSSKKSLFELASPAARKKIVEQKLRSVHSSRLDGRIAKMDVDLETREKYLDLEQENNEEALEVKTTIPQIKELDIYEENDRQESRVTMSRLRKKISERLKLAQDTAAILTTFNEIDMSQVFALRALYKDVFEKKYDIKLGFMSFFVKACVKALQELPVINSRIDGDEIVSSNYIDISVAISAPQGLVVPVLRDADLLEMWEIEKKIYDFGQKAKNNKLSLEEMSGGTFSISNGGVFGSLLSTPIINPPQSAILGMHKIQERPMVVDGKIEIRPMMYVALSYDHRLIDGREAVTFLGTLKKILENPGFFILGL